MAKNVGRLIMSGEFIIFLNVQIECSVAPSPPLPSTPPHGTATKWEISQVEKFHEGSKGEKIKLLRNKI